MLCDERRVLVRGGGVTRFDDFRDASMQLHSNGSQLGFVCHGADQRMTEREFRGPTESHLVDEFGFDERVDVCAVDDTCQQLGVEPGSDHGRGVENALGR